MKTNKTSKSEKFTALRGLAKRVATILLAGAIIVPVALSASACWVTIKDNGDGSYTITPNPNDQGNNNNNQGNTDKEPNISKFSDILKTVITSDYYKELSKISGGNTTLTSQKRQQNPFGFLYQQGYDLSRYLDGELEIESDVYIKGNDTSHLYIASHVESEHEQGNYYTCYVLKYELTKQEYNDLVMLHEGGYIQAPLFIQELTYEKEATIESEARISKKVFNNRISEMKRNSDLNLSNINFDIDFLGYDAPNGLRKFYVHFAVRVRQFKKDSMIDSMILDNNYIRYFTIQTLNSAGNLNTYGNNIFNGPTAGNIINLEQYQNEYETITYFESDDYKVNATMG